jgi:hypothetical protein
LGFIDVRSSMQTDGNQSRGERMMKFLVVIASLATLDAAIAADLPHPQPPPPAPVVGKAPIGKAPIGKVPIGKTPAPVAPVVTKG